MAAEVVRHRAQPRQVEVLDRRVEVAARAGPAVHEEQVRRTLARGRVGDRDSVIRRDSRHEQTSLRGRGELTSRDRRPQGRGRARLRDRLVLGQHPALGSCDVPRRPRRARTPSPACRRRARRGSSARARSWPAPGSPPRRRRGGPPGRGARDRRPGVANALRQAATPHAFSSATKLRSASACKALARSRSPSWRTARPAFSQARRDHPGVAAVARDARRPARGAPRPRDGGPRARRARRGSPGRARRATTGPAPSASASASP